MRRAPLLLAIPAALVAALVLHARFWVTVAAI